jgi:hypothetical protein
LIADCCDGVAAAQLAAEVQSVVLPPRARQQASTFVQAEQPPPLVPPVPVEPPVPVVPPAPEVLWQAGIVAMQVTAPEHSMARQLLTALAMASAFEHIATVEGQFCLHVIANCCSAAPASGLHASTLSQTFSHVATLLPLPLPLPQPCMVPAATASDAKKPTNNAVSFVDMTRDLLVS